MTDGPDFDEPEFSVVGAFKKDRHGRLLIAYADTVATDPETL